MNILLDQLDNLDNVGVMKIQGLTKNLRHRVRQGEWEDLLPSRNLLSEEYNVSPASVSIAMRELAKDGLVRIVPRKGVFVVESNGVATMGAADTIGLRGGYLPTSEELMAMDARSLFSRTIFNGIWERANEEKCPLLLLPGAVGENSLHAESCRNAGVKGVIFLGGEGYAEALELRRDGFPVILANRPVGGTPINFVDYDAAGELREILARFVSLGHRHIGVLCPALTSVPGYYARLRLDFIDQLAQHGIELSPRLYWKSVEIKNAAALAGIAREWMDAPNPPTAIFTWAPNLARQFKNIVSQYAPKKARHLSLACSGYLDEKNADISGFVMPHKECGAALLSGLHETIRNPFHVVQCLVSCHYVEKETLKKAAA